MSEKSETGNIKPIHKKVIKPLEIQVCKPVLVSGPVLKFIPCVATVLGGDIHAIMFSQLKFLSKDMSLGMDFVKGRRISLTRLQQQLPFASRRRLIQVLQDLEVAGFIKVERTRRVNVYIPKSSNERLIEYAVHHEPESVSSNYIVIPSLAEKIGLKNAIVLQQIHIRTHGVEGTNFFIRSLEQWHLQTFPFWGIATVKRIFSNLRELDLIIVRLYHREDDGIVHSYRVNYIKLAEVLGLPIPKVENPFDPTPKDGWDSGWKDWTNPVTLIMQSELQ